MALSIFNSERSAIVLLLAAILVLSLGWLNASWPDLKYDAKHEFDSFFQHKIYNNKEHSINIVLTGDSRVYRGLSPDIFNAEIPNTQTFNFGFSSGGHNMTMFNQVDKLLITDNTKLRAVVLGITPLSLTPKSQTNEEFLHYKKMKPPVIGARAIESINRFFRPFSLSRLKKIIRKKTIQSNNDKYIYFDNGWASSDSKVRDSTYALKSYETVFDNNKVSQQTINTVLEQTKAWRARGIMVVAFRPPTTPAMVALENALSGFNENSFKKSFEAAGGHWVETGDGFETYDGSHLTPESSEKMSKILVTTIADIAHTP